MELFTLNDKIQPDDIIDNYQSLVWTERYTEWGDFELVIDEGLGRAEGLGRGSFLGMSASRRVMVVETIEEPGDGTLKITGRSIEFLLADRINHVAAIASGAASTTQKKTDTPSNLATFFFTSTCQSNTLIPQDNLPFVKTGSPGLSGNIPLPTDTVDYEYSEASVYDTIQTICGTFQLGFAIVRSLSTNSELTQFQVYTGSDRSSWQTTLPPVIFSPELGTLENQSAIESDASLKTVAYVFGQKGSRIVYADGFDTEMVGLARRVMYVDASDVAYTAGATLNSVLDYRGRQALAEQRSAIAFDGEIPTTIPYKYGIDYNLGDIVERRNIRGYATKMMVTEQIFMSDNEGERSYPTLTSLELVVPGSWYAWNRTGVWNQATGVWDAL